jgi:NTE family protein
MSDSTYASYQPPIDFLHQEFPVTVNKQIAYLSLGWDLNKCIPGFVSNMVKGLVTTTVIEAHDLDPDWIADPSQFRKEIEGKLSQNINYPEVKARNLPAYALKVDRSTGTNLTPLSEDIIMLLAQHAENLTELQVKLYCPKI